MFISTCNTIKIRNIMVQRCKINQAKSDMFSLLKAYWSADKSMPRWCCGKDRQTMVSEVGGGGSYRGAKSINWWRISEFEVFHKISCLSYSLHWEFHNWDDKQQISWVIAICWIFISFLWPSGSLLLPAPSRRLERHLQVAALINFDFFITKNDDFY